MIHGQDLLNQELQTTPLSPSLLGTTLGWHGFTILGDSTTPCLVWPRAAPLNFETHGQAEWPAYLLQLAKGLQHARLKSSLKCRGWVELLQ